MKLNVIERGPESTDAADRDAPPVVLVHGLFGRARNMGFFQKRLAQRRRVLAVDVRSHGDSPHGLMHYPEMAADLAETLESLGATPAVVAGHSMGGKVSMVLALTRPELVSRLLVADMPPAPTGHGNSQLARKLLHMPMPDTLNRAGADQLLADISPSMDVRNLLIQNLRLGDHPGWSIGLREIVDSMPFIEGWPEAMSALRYDGPSLFVAGENSPYLQLKHLKTMDKLFPPHKLIVVEGAGHWLHAEKPAEFLQIVSEFIGLEG